MEKLVGQEIRCRIIKLDATHEDIVVDRRALAEEEERGVKERRYSEIREGEIIRGTVRSLTDYGAFVDLGGVDGLLHVGEIAWSHINKPADVLAVGQQVEAKVLKLDPEKRRISLGMKQLLKDPWDSAVKKYKLGERARGTVTRVLEFGAFVELEPGIEGLIHVSEMSWAKKVRIASDVLKSGESVEVVVLGVKQAEHRIALGLKQALGDPWTNVAQSFPAGSVIEGPVTNLTKFGAFVQLAEGIEGMIHVSDISAEKRIEYPQDVLKVGQLVKAQILSVDTPKRLLRLGMKQLVPTSLDEYIAEHRVGDVVTGRMVEVSGGHARVELGDGIDATCRIAPSSPAKELAEATETKQSTSKPDLSSLSSKLKAHWKDGAVALESKPEAARTGQIRKFRIAKLDPAAKKIDLEFA
jgi:small subunit ribosomal protein S1